MIGTNWINKRPFGINHFLECKGVLYDQNSRTSKQLEYCFPNTCPCHFQRIRYIPVWVNGRHFILPFYDFLHACCSWHFRIFKMQARENSKSNFLALVSSFFRSMILGIKYILNKPSNFQITKFLLSPQRSVFP